MRARSRSSQGRIELEHVTFRYANGVTDAVSNLTLRIEPGKTYALVGASGAGKSTILSLILRLYDPTRACANRWPRSAHRHAKVVAATDRSRHPGDVLVSRHDLQQHPVRTARRDEGGSSRAARTAFAHDFIMAQPKGYETVIGDKGCLFPVDNNSVSPSPALSSRMRRFCCSTKRPPRSIPNRKNKSKRPSRNLRPAAP